MKRSPTAIFSITCMMFALSGCAAPFFAKQYKRITGEQPGPATHEVQWAGQAQNMEMIGNKNPFDSYTPFEPETGASLGSLGLNLDLYLSKEGQTLPVEERITRLEYATMAIHRDLKIIAPQLQNLLARYPAPQTRPIPASMMQNTAQGAAKLPPTSLSPVPKPAYKMKPIIEEPKPKPRPQAVQHTVKASTTASQPLKTGVYNIRFGEHTNNTTRIVLDMGSAPVYRYDLDSNENILLIEIPEQKWLGKDQGTVPKSKYIVSYQAFDMETETNGTRIVVQLKGNPVIKQDLLLPPKDGKPHRLVLDLGQGS